MLMMLQSAPCAQMEVDVAGGVRVEDLKRIDINHLSQSELMALSLSSSSAFDLSRTQDVVSPQLDRSVFNESAGGRRQTYSHIHHRSHSRLPGLHPSFKAQRQSYALSDPVNYSVLHYLKHFIDGNYNPPPPPPQPKLDVSHMDLQRVGLGKRKELAGSRLFENGVVVEMQKVNEKGDTLDFGELEKKGDSLFAQELLRRTTGLETEEAVLGFLRDLDGQWCSRRKKRKYVNASVFGDALPIGWKLLLGLRRRDSKVSIYCRRFISPEGRQFMSCTEAAAHLKSYFGFTGSDPPKEGSVDQSSSLAATTDRNGKSKEVIVTVDQSLSNRRVDDRSRSVDDLPEVQHILSAHQKTVKRQKIGRPIGEGVIMKDGKFECQFCHKVFDEKRSYSGHVGIHVRNSGRNSGELSNAVISSKSMEAPLPETVPFTSLKVDPPIEIAQSSISETTDIGANQMTQPAMSDPSPSPRIECLENSAPNLISHSVKMPEEMIDSNITMIEDLNQCTTVMTESNDMVKNDFDWNVNVDMEASCINDSEHVRSNEMEKFGAIDLDIPYEKTIDTNLDDKEALAECSPVPLVQSFQFFPPFSSSKQGENEFSVVAQKLDSVTGFEELRFDDIEPYIPSLAGNTMNLGDHSAIDLGFSSSVGFGSDNVILSSMNTNQLTVCVWCRSEFRLDGIESETPSDSIGYMCPACKAKISGHFGGSLSMGLDDF